MFVESEDAVLPFFELRLLSPLLNIFSSAFCIPVNLLQSHGNGKWKKKDSRIIKEEKKTYYVNITVDKNVMLNKIKKNQ